MRMFDIIQKKKEGLELTKEEIDFFIKGYVNDEISNYQASALCMAIYFKGMSTRETADLTFAIRDSGERLDFSSIKGIRVDKHSTGGVGDKTSMVVAPVVASLGVKVAKMSGRGLGHTGGTVDKLESIPGFRVELTSEEFVDAVNNCGIAIIGQSKNIAPADRKLYALRDVTATVDSLPLIASSIMGKKLAADDDCIVLDVKTGSGAFMKTLEGSRMLGREMVDIGKMAGKKMLALITNMDRPLGDAIGNSLEVIEAIETLKGRGPKDFESICITLASNMLFLAEYGTIEECEELVKKTIKNGKAVDTFKAMIKCQGGNEKCVDDYSLFAQAKYTKDIKIKQEGYIARVDAEGYGIASLLLGAGRNTIKDQIDYSAGIMLKKKTGDYVKVGDVVATMYTSDESKFDEAEEKFLESTIIEELEPVEIPLVLDRII